MTWLLGEFVVESPGIDEEAVQARHANGQPAEIAMAISSAKGKALLEGFPDAVIVTADTLVVYDGRILGKPANECDNLRMLQLLAGDTHSVVTGVTVTTGESQIKRSIETRVTMRGGNFPDLEQYSQSGEGMDKAGGYGIQGSAGTFVERVKGCYANVVGFPLCLVSMLLNQAYEARIDDPVALCVAAAESVRRTGSGETCPFNVSPHPMI